MNDETTERFFHSLVLAVDDIFFHARSTRIYTISVVHESEWSSGLALVDVARKSPDAEDGPHHEHVRRLPREGQLVGCQQLTTGTKGFFAARLFQSFLLRTVPFVCPAGTEKSCDYVLL